LTVTQKTPPKAREADDGDGRVSLKEYGDPAHADEGHQSHILDSGAKVRGQQGYSACFNAGQDRFSTWVDLLYGDQEQEVLSPDTQSFTAAIKLV